MRRWFLFALLCTLLLSNFSRAADPKVDYEKQVAPLLKRYCAGCHNDSDHDGDFSLESFASLQKGIKSKPAVLPGNPAGSRMWFVLHKGGDQQMPPEGEPAPNDAEKELIRLWIEQGAIGPAGTEPDRLMLHVPQIASQTKLSPVTALAFSPDGTLLAVGRYRNIELLAAGPDPIANWKAIRTLTDLPGKVESLEFNRAGTALLSASGVVGSGGLATLWNVNDGTRLREIPGHRDVMLAARLSPDEKMVATCSYDKDICLWNLETGALIRTMSGHNGAVYDIAFHPAGTVLASASADDTCKLWRVRDGERLDTLGQPLKEQYAIGFSLDGKSVLSVGADNRLRVWNMAFGDQPGINPLEIARFAHEAPISTFCYSANGTELITAAEDRTLKVWDADQFTELQFIEHEPDVVVALAADPQHPRVVLGRIDGTLALLALPSVPSPNSIATVETVPEPTGEAPTPVAPQEFQEVEPNNSAVQAQPVTLPARITGIVNATGVKDQPSVPDLDCFKFTAKKGEIWVVDVDASRSKSELDSFVEILTADGEQIPRTLLQAVRDSYFTFRGKNSSQTGDLRIFNWQEMSVNELLYCNGEVVKLWQAPRGPDSGFDVYPGEGNRWNYFDTSGLSHALEEPCYIVKPHPPGTELIANGLPVFKLFYENDDASHRESGSDSKLFFTAPADGDYVLRIRDARGSSSPQQKYTISIRPPAPDFSVSLADLKPQVTNGNRVEVRFKVNRVDQFDGPITIKAESLPPGMTINTPLLIQPEQVDAFAVLSLEKNFTKPTADQLKAVKLTATATINGRSITHPIPAWTEMKISEKPDLELVIRASPNGIQPLPGLQNGPLEFVIHPGETIMLELIVERNGSNAVISFGKEDSGRNLPHGVYVDNIGLNGLLLLSDQNVREFFITASPWVPEQTRMFHLQSAAKNGAASAPVILHVRPRPQPVAATANPAE